MKLLIVTNLFPNAAEPNRATFNFQQFSALAKLCELKVVAPVPFFRFSRKEVPSFEKINGIEVYHPRYLAIPKIFRFTHGPAFFLGIWHTLRSVQKTFDFDVVLASWAYPDAFGTALAADKLKKRFYVKVQGSDINLAHKYWGRVRMIKSALGKAEKIIAVSRPLKEKLVSMGIAEIKIVVIPNGVDKAKFHPRDKAECRRALRLNADRKIILFIGNLAEVKGVEYLVQAFKKLSTYQDTELLIVGDGPLRSKLEALTEELGIKGRVLFKGRRSYDEVSIWLNATDVLCLPSLNEGCPNVVLEALACGTRVVASNVGGVPDIIDSPEKGWLAKPGDPDDLERQLKDALEASVLSTFGQSMSWKENAGQFLRVLSSL